MDDIPEGGREEDEGIEFRSEEAQGRFESPEWIQYAQYSERLGNDRH